MIKLNANVSKKVPVPDVEFSSQSYSAGMEVELSSGSTKDEMNKRLRALYALLEEAINEQIQGRQGGNARGSANGSPKPARNPNSRPEGNGQQNGRRATKAQIGAIHAITKEQGYSEADLKELVSGSFGVDGPSALSIGQASSLIDTLKNNGKE